MWPLATRPATAVCALPVIAAFLVACGATATVVTPTALGSTPTATPASSTPTAATVGTTYTLDDGSGNVMEITLTTLINPATSALPPDAGSYLVAAKFQLVGKTGTYTGDAFVSASAIGGDHQTYSGYLYGVNGCTDFNSGSFSVSPGQTSVGCVAFQLPNAVKPAQVMWTELISSGKPATWDV